MKLTNLGQCGFLFDFGSFRLVTDPYLSDYIDACHAGTDDPWVRNYPPISPLIDLRPDLVLISHSHDDHMDPWTLTRYREAGGDCAIAAPAPECGFLEKAGFSHIIYARAEQAFSMGGVNVTPIICAHTEPHVDAQGRFRELSYLIEADGLKFLFGGDLSIYDGLAERVAREKVGFAILPCNGRDEERAARNIIGNTDAEEAARLAKVWNCSLIPSHYDLYDGNGCPPEKIRRAADEAGARLIMPAPNTTIEL